MKNMRRIHSGETLKKMLIIPLELNITDASVHLNFSRKKFSTVSNERGAITSEAALSLDSVFKKTSAVQPYSAYA